LIDEKRIIARGMEIFMLQSATEIQGYPKYQDIPGVERVLHKKCRLLYNATKVARRTITKHNMADKNHFLLSDAGSLVLTAWKAS